MLEDQQTRDKAALGALLLEDGNALMDVDYELELVGGNPAEAIAGVAETRDADEIVIRSPGFGRLRSAAGSASHELPHLADRLVVDIPYVREHAGAQS